MAGGPHACSCLDRFARPSEGERFRTAVICGFFFFFQAEDGIRDLTVTGVQTCALPISSFGVAMVAALWAYEGWNNVTFAAGEVERPERTLPLALVVGTALVIAIYGGLNLVYFRVLTLSEIAASPRVAADAARRLVGPWGSQLTAVAIVVAVFGSLNGSILAGARGYYAMAKDRLFFRWSAAGNPRFRTPHLSLVVQGLWSCLLVLLADYEQLFTYTVFAAWIFYALTALAVIILRRAQPEL